MDVRTEVASESGIADRMGSSDFGFLPDTLIRQCKSLIESYHEMHGYACLPDVLWKSRLGPFIEKHRELHQHLKKASTTRSAKKSHRGFVQIATTMQEAHLLAGPKKDVPYSIHEQTSNNSEWIGKTADLSSLPN